MKKFTLKNFFNLNTKKKRKGRTIKKEVSSELLRTPHRETLMKKEFSFSRMSTKDQTFFVKRLSFLVKAGVPILDSLIMIKEQTKKKSYAKILDKIISDVSNGQNLSSSLAKYPKIFGDFSVNIIAFGESAGILSENLDYLADELKKDKH